MSSISSISPAKKHKNKLSDILISKKFTYSKAIILFLTPALLFYAVFILYPVIESIYYSFCKVEVFGVNAKAQFIGLKNYIDVFNDKVFWKAAANTLIWAFSSPFLEIPLGLLLALTLKKGTNITKFLRVVWFTPVLMPQIVVGIIWAWIYNSEWGLLNEVLSKLGLGVLQTAWLGTPATALPSLIVVTTWMWTGFNMVILLAAVSAIPNELLESAHIDGAKSYQVLYKIIIPMIKPVLANLMILCFIGKMKVFDLIWATTLGGPMWSTETVATYTVKRAFYWSTFEKGYPSAIASMWFYLILIISIAMTAAFNRKEKLEY